MASKYAPLLVIFLILAIVAGFLLGSIRNVGGPRQVIQTTTPLEVETPTKTIAQKTTPRLEVYKEPFFTLETESLYIVVAQGGEFSFKVRVKPWNNYRGEVELATIGVQMYEVGVETPTWLYQGELVSVEIDPEIVTAGEYASVRVKLDRKLPPGRYILAISGSNREYKNILVVPFHVYRYPSYIVVPRLSKPIANVGEEFEILLDVKPLGGYREEVELKVVDYSGLRVVSFENSRGIPPFTAKAVVVLEENLWRDFVGEGGRRRESFSNNNVYLVVEGEKKEARAVVFFGVEKVEEPGIVSILTLPFRLVLGINIGLVTGFSLGLLFPQLAVGNSVVATSSLFTPELVMEQVSPERGLSSINLGDNGYFTTFLRVGAVNKGTGKLGSILLPSARVYVNKSGVVQVPFIAYTGGFSATIEAIGVYRERTLIPPFEEKIKTINLDIEIVERGQDYVKGLIKIPGNLVEIYVRLISSEKGVIDQVLLETYYPGWTREDILVYGSPGERVVAVIPVSPYPWYPSVREETYRYLPRRVEFSGVKWIMYTDFEEVGGTMTKIEEAVYVKTASIASIDIKPLLRNLAIVIVELEKEASPGYYRVGIEISSPSGSIEIARLHILVEVQGEIPPYKR